MLFINSLDSSYILIQIQRFILGTGMAKRFGIVVKYYASSLGIQMCNHWAPKTYLSNGTLEECGFKSNPIHGFFNSIGLNYIFNSCPIVCFGYGYGEAFWDWSQILYKFFTNSIVQSLVSKNLSTQWDLRRVWDTNQIRLKVLFNSHSLSYFLIHCTQAIF